MSGRRQGRDDEALATEAEGTPAAEQGSPEGGLVAAAPADEAEELRRERDGLRDELLRRRADFENFRRRVERDRATAALEAEAALLRQLLGTVDNLERALASGTGDAALREGVQLTYRELVSLLESVGVVALDPAGQVFDPSEHQAIVHEPAPGFEAGTVAEVLRKGFKYKDRLLRPALVKVASGASDETESESGEVL